MCKAIGSKFVVARALVIFKWYGAKLAAGDYWLLQSMHWKKITMCNIDVNAASAWDACGHQNNCQLLYDNNLQINNDIFGV